MRCAKCKRKNWNKVKGDVVRAPKTRKRKPKAAPAAEPSTPPGHVTQGDVMEDLGLIEPDPVVVEPEKPLPAAAAPEPVEEPVLPTIVRQPTAAKYREILKQLAAPEHKIGEKCPHGWSNWLQCPKCNQKVG